MKKQKGKGYTTFFFLFQGFVLIFKKINQKIHGELMVHLWKQLIFELTQSTETEIKEKEKKFTSLSFYIHCVCAILFTKNISTTRKV